MGCAEHSRGVGSDFSGSTASHYATFRRDVPDALLDQVASRLALSAHDRALDLGCGTGQVAVPLAARVGLVFALDPEPDMLTELRARVSTAGVVNVLPVLGADADLRPMTQLFGQWFAVITVANALHWMDTDHVFSMCRQLAAACGRTCRHQPGSADVAGRIAMGARASRLPGGLAGQPDRLCSRRSAAILGQDGIISDYG
jgi:SAM-dependent methyltransferase